jgi:tetratricopeptide (TPR) repeat protein
MYFAAAKFDKAAALLERAREADPLNSQWLSELVRVYAQNGEKEKHVKLLAELAPTDADDIDVRKEAAQLYLDLSKPVEAERFAREALEIDVLDPVAQQALAEALAGQKKYKPAIEAFLVAITAREQKREIVKADDARLKLAHAYRDNGQKKEALIEVIKVLAHDENNARAKALKAELEK